MDKLSPDIERKIRKAKLMLLGGSAGSFMLIHQLVNALAPDFDLPAIVIVHRGKEYSGLMSSLLQENARVKVKEAEEKEPLQAGTIYLAPSDYHLLIEADGTLSLDYSEQVLYSRPSINVTFESAADIYGGDVIAFLFSGASEDGASGLSLLHRSGALALVQDPRVAEFPQMPQAAVNRGAYDLLFRAADLPFLVAEIHRIRKNVHT